MLATAGRVGEILEMTWDQIDFEAGTINLRKQADGPRKGRAIAPMNRTARAALLTAREARLTGHVIEWAGEPVKRIIKGVKTAAKSAKLSGVTPHVLRHTAAVWMASSLMTVLTDSSGHVLVAGFGVCGALMRATAFVDAIQVTASTAGWTFTGIRTSPGVTHVRIGNAHGVVTIDLSAEPETYSLSVFGPEETGRLFAAALGQPPTWTQTYDISALGEEDDDDDDEEEEPVASITTAAYLTVSDPWEEGDGFTVTAPVISGTPFAGPSVVWEFRAGGEWADGTAWVSTVPSLDETVDVRLRTEITPVPGGAAVIAHSDTYQAVKPADVETPPPPLRPAEVVAVEADHKALPLLGREEGAT